GVDPMLPSWGTGRWEWRETLPFDRHPQMINPEQGWIANWNNKPAVGWDNSQSSAWGPTHRVGLLARRMEALLAVDNKASLSDVVDVIREAATADARAEFLGEALLDFTDDVTGAAAQARQHVADWIAGGAHRLDRNRNELQDFGPAVAVFDRWYDELAHRVFDDELGASYPYLNLAIPISDDASVNNGSAYYSDFSNFLWNLFRDDTKAAYARDYCENIGTEEIETCESVAVDALEAAVEDLATEKPGPIETWTWPADYIEFSEVGAYGVDPIPWQNRGTYNHAIEVLGGR
ncbi:MAG: penicillin acylase family protein, partial [Actinomycetota bacterium]